MFSRLPDSQNSHVTHNGSTMSSSRSDRSARTAMCRNHGNRAETVAHWQRTDPRFPGVYLKIWTALSHSDEDQSR